MKIKVLLTAVVSISMTACSMINVSEVVRTGDKEFPSLQNNCDVKIYTTSPKKEFFEVGMIDLRKCAYFEGCPDTASKALKAYRKDVCEVGGNGLLLWEVNGYGNYIKATAIRTM
jgi:hypothetical protein